LLRLTHLAERHKTEHQDCDKCQAKKTVPGNHHWLHNRKNQFPWLHFSTLLIFYGINIVMLSNSASPSTKRRKFQCAFRFLGKKYKGLRQKRYPLPDLPGELTWSVFFYQGGLKIHD
jgi:hypothetical protein